MLGPIKFHAIPQSTALWIGNNGLARNEMQKRSQCHADVMEGNLKYGDP